MNRSPFRYWFISPGCRRAASLTRSLATTLRALPPRLSDDADQDLVIALASDVLAESNRILPNWVGPDSRFLIVMDLPEPAVLRLPALLGLRRPDLRMHVSRDPSAAKRALIALRRERAWETIVDAYVLNHCLVVVLGDLSIREFPCERLPGVSRLSKEEFASFEMDSSGSFLYWPSVNVHLGPSQMLQAVDPMHLADVEIHRYALEKTSVALLRMRERRQLKQSGISGLSERQVRRLEKEESRLTMDACMKYATAFDQGLDEFVKELSKTVGELRDPPFDAEERRRRSDPQHVNVG